MWPTQTIVNVPDTRFGSAAVVTGGVSSQAGPKSIPGTVTLTLTNGRTTTVTLGAGGGFTVQFGGLQPGTYGVAAHYNGEGDFLPSDAQGTFTVSATR